MLDKDDKELLIEIIEFYRGELPYKAQKQIQDCNDLIVKLTTKQEF